MAGLNRVMLIGNLGRDPEIRYSQSGSAVCNFSIATSEQWNDKNTGERQEKTEWHRIVVFGKQAETCEKYLTKGSKIYVEGRLQTRSWEKDGQNHYTTEVVVSSFQFLGGRGDNQGGGGGYQNQGGYQQGGQGRQSPQGQSGYQNQGQNQGGYQHNPDEYSPRAQTRDQYRQPQGGKQGNPGGPDPIPDGDIPF